jgi:hypothetical protein
MVKSTHSSASSESDVDWNDECIHFDIKKIEAKRCLEAQEEMQLEIKKAALRKSGKLHYQEPPSGTWKRLRTRYGFEIDSYVPVIKEGTDKDAFKSGVPNIWYVCTEPTIGKTVIDVPNFHGHLITPSYVHLVHARAIGKINEWRNSVKACVGILMEEQLIEYKFLREQSDWAENIAEKLQNSLSEFDLFPVSHLNIEAIMSLVKDADDPERAHFLLHMCRSKRIETAVVKNKDGLNISIVTLYDYSSKNKFAYGQKEIE